MPIEMGKEYYTDQNGPMRILCIDGPDEDYPVSAITKGGMYFTFSLNGECSIAPSTAAYMLKECKKPQKYRREFWVNILPTDFPNSALPTYSSKEEAIEAVKYTENVIDTVKIIIQGETTNVR